MVPLAGDFGICQFTHSQVTYNCTSKALEFTTWNQVTLLISHYSPLLAIAVKCHKFVFVSLLFDKSSSHASSLGLLEEKKFPPPCTANSANISLQNMYSSI